MAQITITEVTYTGDIAGAELFNSNFLPNANSGETPWGGNSGNPLGTPTSHTEAALDAFDIDYVRFPAGQDKELFAEHGLMDGGDIPDFVRNFLTHAQAEGIQVSMVVPVETLEQFGGPSLQTLQRDMVDFAEIIERDFPGVVQHYELGNEYWGKRDTNDPTRETEYGIAAAEAALALQAGTEAAGGEVQVVLQTASFLGGAFDGNITEGNAAIQAGWDSVTTDTSMIVGVLRNFYWRDPGVNEFHNTDGIFSENRGIDESFEGVDGGQWDDWLGREALRIVGEFNVMNSVNTNLAWHGDIGLHGASMLLEHMTNMIDAGVDLAFVWPVLHNTHNALVHVHQDLEFATVHGFEVVTNSTRAALFDVMRQTVSDYELVEFAWTAPIDVELTGFSGIGEDGIAEQVLIFSSRTDDAETVQIDISEFVTDFSSVEGISIHYVDDGDASHRDAVVTEVDIAPIGSDGMLDLSLQPYEVVQIIFDVVSTLDGTADDDELFATPADDTAMGLDGNDTIIGQDGADTLYGGRGDDVIDGGSGNDRIYGDDGIDILRGGAGADRVYGGAGNDVLYGQFGNDTLYGEGNSDAMSGGHGDDYLSGGWGFDTIAGDAGQDTLNGGTGYDVLTGGADADVFVFDTFDGSVDVITDFEIGTDILSFDFDQPGGPSGFVVESHGDGTSSMVRFTIDGVIQSHMGGVILEGIEDTAYAFGKEDYRGPDLFCYI